jgi:hypothetical protein
MTGLSNQFFLIYKTTNLLNGKIYIGKHMTSNKEDGYMGSGKLLKRAISKFGIENFKREILFECSSEKEMNEKEAEIVNEEFLKRNDVYNLCPGGKGGWGYLNDGSESHKLRSSKAAMKTNKILAKDLEFRKRSSLRLSESNKILHKEGKLKAPDWTGKSHSEETKLKMSNSHKGKYIGKNNSQFGSIWINNGIEVKKIKGPIPEGWSRGRKLLDH